MITSELDYPLAADTPPVRTPRPPTDQFRAPERLSDLGVTENLVDELFLKHAYKAGDCTIASIAASLRLPVHLAELAFRKLKLQNFIEVRGTRGEDFAFCLTSAGKASAIERQQGSRYAGPLPVPLAQYESAVRSQVARTRLNRARLEAAYQDLTLPADLLARLGPALVAQKSMFLYGPSGTGKSSLAERVLRIYRDRIAVPHAVEIGGNIVSVFDSSVHRPAGPQRTDDDPRWVFCERPSVIVGGELVSEMLELQRDPERGQLIAPLHMKANNGIFVIDDFGRQPIAPRDLLNRWIVPLDRRVDYLTVGGAKFPVPFEVFVVFSTNLNPSDLADEAFLRRIPNKVLVDSISTEVFDHIVGKRLKSSGWHSEAGAAEHLRTVCEAHGGGLRPCYPRDLCEIIQSIAEFEERAPELTKSDVDRAAELYYGVPEAAGCGSPGFGSHSVVS
jgi:predicted ATPase with chaperone activity